MLRISIKPARASVGLLARVAAVASLMLLAIPASASAYLSTRNDTPFPSSKLIVGASWTSRRYGPPANQWGDVLPTIWAADGNQYAMIDDGGADVPISGGLWRNSLAVITGAPPKLRFRHIGDPRSPPPHTFSEIRRNPSIWQGPLGRYYSSGLVTANKVLFATQESDWDWNANGPFRGLAGIAYSLDYGRHWNSVNKPFPAPLGNLSWVVRGQGGVYRDGYVYAIGSDREFNANLLIIGRARPDVGDLTDPTKWQWLSGWTPTAAGGQAWPVFSSAFASAVPILTWASHFTYPQMAYDSPIGRYLLTFSFSYAEEPPAIWQNGAELVILEAPHPWGPFSFVAREPEFGPSNGYSAGFPIKWISRNGRDLWLKWSANFDGCEAHLDCSGGYGFNYRRVHLRLAGDRRLR